MLPINIFADRLDHLAWTFGYQTGSLPFTYLGLPVGTTRPSIDQFKAMVHRVERILISTSIFLTQAGKLELVRSLEWFRHQHK
jgi:hypothetical protein